MYRRQKYLHISVDTSEYVETSILFLGLMRQKTFLLHETYSFYNAFNSVVNFDQI